MAVNDFLPYATDPAAYVDTQAQYAAETQLPTGMYTGLVRKEFFNKVLRQAAFMASVLAQTIVDLTGSDVLDDGNTATKIALLKSAMAGGKPKPIAFADSPYTANSGDNLQVDASLGNVVIVVSPTTYDVLVERTDTTAANQVVFNNGTANVDAITSVCAVAGIQCPWKRVNGNGSTSIITSGSN